MILRVQEMGKAEMFFRVGKSNVRGRALSAAGKQPAAGSRQAAGSAPKRLPRKRTREKEHPSEKFASYLQKPKN